MIASDRHDYSLIGPCAQAAAQEGLVAAEWYHTDVPRKRMKELMRRRDWPAARDTLIWFGLLAGFAFGAYWFWDSWWCAPFFLCYGVLYGSASDSRWHETGHGTAFRTSWVNDAIYQVASFMNMKEPTLWRWSHARHHTDTIIVGRDREIAAMRPPDLLRIVPNLLCLTELVHTSASVVRHAAGHLTEVEQTFIPRSEQHKVVREARAWIGVYAIVVAACIYFDSILPALFIGLPTLYGFWLGYLFGLSQHAGLAENVLDHRLNSRTIRMNRVARFIFWNMNFHVEHHMFPMVPYHALPELHAEVAHDMPAPYGSLLGAYREIVPTLWRQLREPQYHVERELPACAKPFRPELHEVVFQS
ncbi:MAG: fatty acid desaturase family protein [Solirubrobacteraceae bacterium]|jgi:fatty acid desaturase